MRLSIDTNLLVYVQDGRDEGKREVATALYRRLVERDDVFVGLQVGPDPRLDALLARS